MTGKERTLRALSFEPVDRAPVAGGLIGNAEFLAEVAGAPDFWADPRRIAFDAYRRLGCDAVLGPVLPKHPDTTARDADGRPTFFTKQGERPTLDTPEAVVAYAREVRSPAEIRQALPFQAAYDEYLALVRNGEADSGEMLFIPHCLGYAPHFPSTGGPFDYAAFLMACALYGDEMAPLFRAWGEESRLRLEAVAKATVDHGLLRLIWIGTDICSRKGSVLSPRLLDALYFPALARAIEPLEEAGMKVVWHADANYTDILPRMIELGIDGFQGFYEEEGGMQLDALAAMRSRAGQPLILFGSVSTVRVLPRGSVEDVRREVARCLRAAEGRGGLLLAPTSSIGPEVPKESIRAMYDEARTRVAQA